MMELLNILYNLMSLVFVLGTMASMGLSLTMAQNTKPYFATTPAERLRGT